ncbi:hypothetical protein AB0L06_20690 [Spirillospora sp. NPDC052269]
MIEKFTFRDEGITIMNLAQLWPMIAACVAVIGVVHRQISLLRSELTTRIDTKIDSVTSRFDAKFEGVDAKFEAVNARIDGLRNEVLAALQPMSRMLERLDQDMRDHIKEHNSSG